MKPTHQPQVPSRYRLTFHILKKHFTLWLTSFLIVLTLACKIFNPVPTPTPVPSLVTTTEVIASSTATQIQISAAPTLPETTSSLTPTPVPLSVLFPRLEAISVRNVEKLQPIAQLSAPDVQQAAFSPDGKKLALGMGSTVEIWDLASGQLAQHLGNHEGGVVNYLSFSPDGGFLLSRAGYAPAFHDAVIVWDLSNGQKIRVLDEITAAISPDWRVLATEPLDSYSSIIKLTDFETNMELGVLNDPTNSIMDINFSPDGQRVAMMLIGVDSALITVWDLPSRKSLVNLDEMLKLAFSPDGKFAAGGSWRPHMHIFETKTWTEIASLSGSKDLNFLSPLFTPDGSMVVGAFGDQIKLFETGSWKELATLSAPDIPNALTFSPDGRLLASYYASENTFFLWGVVP